MKKILLILSLVFFKQVNSQTYVTIPDANLVTYLQSIIPGAMNSNQMDTSNTLVTTTTHTIIIPSNNIANLFGIQYFSSLIYFDCSQNPNPHPNPNTFAIIPKLPGILQYFDCSNNHLANLPVLPNSLQTLRCVNNVLTLLPLLPNNLLWLGCYQNSLTSLPQLPNSLTYLHCENNSIACFPSLPNAINSISIDPNPYNCLPNYISAMSPTDLAIPLCTTGNTNGCAIAGINQLSINSKQVLIYPNPSNGFISIANSTNTIDEIKITDMLGQIVYTDKPNSRKINLQIEKSGIYFVTITSENKSTTQKIVVQY